MIADTLQPSYYAVIFMSFYTKDDDGCLRMAIEMNDPAKQQPNYLSVKSVSEELDIPVSYWKSLKAIKNGKPITRLICSAAMTRKNGTGVIKHVSAR